MGVVNGPDYEIPTLDLNFAKNKSLVDSISGRNLITFTRAQSGYRSTYVDSNGIMRYANADEPRFDHNPTTNQSLGLLVEESRTNQNTNSIGSNLLASPPKLFQDLGFGTFTMPAGTNYALWGFGGGYGNTWSVTFYLYKIAGNDVVSFSVVGSQYSGLSSASTTVDGITLTSTSELGGPVSASITNLGNNLYKLNAITKVNSIGALPSVNLSALGTFTGTEKCYVSHIQAEIGSFPTSYIPTSGTTVTRTADNASITGTNFSSWYNQSQGTAFIGGRTKQNTNSNAGWASFFQTSSYTTNRISIRVNNTDVTSNSIQVAGFAQASPGFDSPANIALAYRENDFALDASYQTLQTDTSGSVPSFIDRLEIGNIESANIWINGTISRLTYYPKRLPNNQLQYLTR